MDKRIFVYAAAALMLMGAFMVLQEAEDSDAASYGTSSNPRTSVSLTWTQVRNNDYTEMYVVTGSSFSITRTNSYECWSMTDEQGFNSTSAWGLTIGSTGTISGRLSGTGSTTLTYYDVTGGIAIPYYVTVYIVQGSQPAGTYAQSIHLGNYDSWEYRTYRSGSGYTSWSQDYTSDGVIYITSGDRLQVRWNYTEMTYLTSYVDRMSRTLYGTDIGSSVTVNSDASYYPAYKLVDVTIYNTTADAGVVYASVVDDYEYGSIQVVTVFKGQSDILRFPSNSTIELEADNDYPYVFDYWSVRSQTTSSANPLQYTLDGSNSTIVDVYWKSTPYVVSFNANGGSVSPTTKNVYYGWTYGTLPVPTRQGYGFDGWYTAATGGTQVTSSTSVPYSSTGNITLYAHWTANTYTIVFNASTNGGTPDSTGTRTYGSTFGDMPTPSKVNYNFSGWYTAATGGTKITSSSTVPYSSSGTITLYAQFTQITYTVTVSAASGGYATIYQNSNPSNTATAQAGRSATITVPIDSYVTATAYPDSSHHFTNWTYNNLTIDTNPYSGPAVRSNVTYAANFGNGAIHTVTFDYWTNGGSGVSFPTKEVINGDYYGELPIAIKEGMEFDGWYTAATGGNKITSSSRVNLSSNQTLYAQFVNNPLTVTISINYGTATMTDGTQSVSVSGGASPVSMTTRETVVTVSAAPGSGFNFNYWNYFWNGDTSSSGGFENDNPWELTLMGDVEIFGICSQAVISKPYYAYVNSSGYGSISDGVNTGSFLEGTVNVGDVVSISDNTITIGDATITATPNTGYIFSQWTGVTNGQVIQNSDSEISFTANFSSTLISVPYHATVNNERYGMISDGTQTGADLTGTVQVGDRILINGNAVTIGSVTITATASSEFVFIGWSGITNNSIVRDTAEGVNFTANFSSPNVWWSNNLYNGSVTLACRFTGGNSNLDHHMTIPLYSGSVEDGAPIWTLTPYTLEIDLSYPQTTVTVTLLQNENPVSGYPISKTIGKWSGFELEIDADKGRLNFTPMDRFSNYTSYTTFTSRMQTIADWSNITSGNAIYAISHADTGRNGSPMSFQVVRTMPFLNTFGVVMTNPSINVHDYFPDYEKVRLNFYSFALYGDMMRVNGKQIPVDEGSVTIYYYTDVNKVNHWVDSMDSPTPENPYGERYVVKSKTMMLSNIYVTWNGDTCSLTFVNDKFSVDLGTYSAGNETVSFEGFWYFTTTLYEPITVTEKSIDGSWKAMPDIGGPAMILLYLGALLGLGLIAHVKLGLKWLDLTVLAIGMLLGFTLLG